MGHHSELECNFKLVFVCIQWCVIRIIQNRDDPQMFEDKYWNISFELRTFAFFNCVLLESLETKVKFSLLEVVIYSLLTNGFKIWTSPIIITFAILQNFFLTSFCFLLTFSSFFFCFFWFWLASFWLKYNHWFYSSLYYVESFPWKSQWKLQTL